MRSLRLLLPTLVVALCVSAPAFAIVGGAPDGNAHPYVGLVRDGVSACSGTLVSRTVFVTVAHCFTDSETVLVSFDPAGFSNPGRTEFAGTFHADPQFCLQCGNGLPRFDTHDVGVVVLASPVPAGVVPRLASLPSVDASTRLGNHAAVAVVGYGIQSFTRGGGSKPQPASGGTRAVSTTTLGNAGASVASMLLKIPPAGGICSGDSGGPVLSGDVVLGVNAFFSSTYCDGDAYAYRLDTPDELAFVRSFLS
jgi:hypothetical protein